jgi:hypothetical protein
MWEYIAGILSILVMIFIYMSVVGLLISIVFAITPWVIGLMGVALIYYVVIER